MSAKTIPQIHAPASSIADWSSRLSLNYALVDGRTTLIRRSHDGALMVQKPLYPEGREVCHTLVLFPPGGIAGGDSLHIAVDLAAASRVLISAPAAGKWYRSTGRAASQQVAITIAAGASLEWLPPENIVFDAAQAHASIKVKLAANACYLGWELNCLGRTASQEEFRSGLLRQVTELWLEKKLLWGEYASLPGGDPLLASPIGLAGRTVVGSFLCAGKNLSAELLGQCRALKVREALGDRCGVTTLPNLFVARYLGHSSERGRHYFENLWSLLRPFFLGRPACPPRIWKT